ncbi:phosphotransferase family protein [Sphingobium nicotianae]|uniref:Phosphotransferase n=1 Tax=Sphingobium nicotianae TaxID=2782607 RepID=A0A9X1IQU7_9SPHN|nr:aminoglycoside phosphotransferase family protein [Sphingobium nicotianae]MBT2186901.1 phosphotransferase [Sphingobium nicotianae]
MSMISESQILDMVQRARPRAQPVGITPLTGSSTAVAYRIDLDSGETLALKTYAAEPRWRPAKERLVMDWIAGKALPVPVQACLLLDDDRTDFSSSAALLTWLPGAPLKDFRGDPSLPQAYRQTGALLRQVHGIAMPHYGHVFANGVDEPHPDNESYMAATFDNAFRRYRNRDGDPDLGRRIERAVCERRALMAESGGAVLCHDDIHPGNLIGDRDAQGTIHLTGLIDWGNARCADPLFDLAKALFCCTHDDPVSPVPIREGYGPIDHSDPDGALWLYTLHHRVSMWAFLPDGNPGRAGLIADLHAMLGEAAARAGTAKSRVYPHRKSPVENALQCVSSPLIGSPPWGL